MQATAANLWPGPPGAPTSVSATATGTTTASVSFTVPSNLGVPALTSYTVVSSPGNLTANGASSPITITGLTTNTSYTFTVFATSSIGNGPSSSPSASITTLAVPGAPTSASASAGAGQATVSFSAPSFAGVPASITGYRVTSSPGGITATGSNSPIIVTGLNAGTSYTFTVAATNSTGYGPESTASNAVTPTSPQLYAFTNATFTPGGLTGPTGPDLATARTGLTGTGVDVWKNNTAYFNTSNGIQLWTVPATGSYRIIAAGSVSATRRTSGRGAIFSGTFSLTEGQIIRILCGQQDQLVSTNTPTGGGGGTFVVASPYNTNASILVVAGGGGGTHDGTSGYNQSTADASFSTSGNPGTPGGWSGGSGGAGGTYSGGSQGSSTGAGFSGDGQSRNPMFPASDGENPKSFTTGGTGGGINGSSSTKGGFGGGGFTWYSSGWGGGGGGYSGGGSGSNSSYNGNAGGGASYNNGTSQSQDGYNSGSGYVTITKL